MHRVARLVLSGLVLLACAACDPAPSPSKQEAETLGRDADATVIDDTLQTQDRARAVEDLTLGRKAELDAAVEQAEGTAAEEP